MGGTMKDPTVARKNPLGIRNSEKDWLSTLSEENGHFEDALREWVSRFSDPLTWTRLE